MQADFWTLKFYKALWLLLCKLNNQIPFAVWNNLMHSFIGLFYMVCSLEIVDLSLGVQRTAYT